MQFDYSKLYNELLLVYLSVGCVLNIAPFLGKILDNLIDNKKTIFTWVLLLSRLVVGY